MRIIIDTNIVISGAFFNGLPKTILKSVADEKFDVFISDEILKEYHKSVNEMLEKDKYHLNFALFEAFMKNIKMIESKSNVKICRDPDDDKFINCAIDAKAIYIVSGDKDLLTIGQYEDIEILTAKEFYDKYLA